MLPEPTHGGALPAGPLFLLSPRILPKGPFRLCSAAGIFFVSGRHVLGLVRIPLLCRGVRFEAEVEPTTIAGAGVTGLTYGFGRTPGAGPALAAVLMVASGLDTIRRGAPLLFVDGAGIAVPFVLAAVFARPFPAWTKRNRRYLADVEKATGLMLVPFAVLIATGPANVIADFIIRDMPSCARTSPTSSPPAPSPGASGPSAASRPANRSARSGPRSRIASSSTRSTGCRD